MAVTKSISSGGNATSDAAVIPTSAVATSLIVKADNNGTPASGDILEIRLLATVGDPDADGDSTDEYTTPSHGAVLVRLNTNLEDPALSAPLDIPTSVQGIKLYAVSSAASNSITVSAQMNSLLDDGTEEETQIQWT